MVVVVDVNVVVVVCCSCGVQSDLAAGQSFELVFREFRHVPRSNKATSWSGPLPQWSTLARRSSHSASTPARSTTVDDVSFVWRRSFDQVPSASEG